MASWGTVVEVVGVEVWLEAAHKVLACKVVDAVGVSCLQQAAEQAYVHDLSGMSCPTSKFKDH